MRWSTAGWTGIWSRRNDPPALFSFPILYLLQLRIAFLKGDQRLSIPEDLGEDPVHVFPGHVGSRVRRISGGPVFPPHRRPGVRQELDAVIAQPSVWWMVI